MTAIASPPTQNGAAAGAPPHVRLGEHEYPIYAQRHAYLTNRLGKAITGLQEMGDMDTSSLEGAVGSLGHRSYDLLRVFIPQLMPDYEYAGFPTREAMEAGDYQEDYDRSPTVPEIAEAFAVALRVNRLDLLKGLGKVVNVDLIKAYISRFMVDFMEARSPSLPSSSSEADTSDSTSSGATSPTLTPSEGSLSPA